MSEMTDFFQNQARECKRLSAQASEKDDREYWLRLAHRWEWLFQQNGGTKTVQPFRPTRSALDKRFAKTVSRLFVSAPAVKREAEEDWGVAPMSIWQRERPPSWRP